MLKLFSFFSLPPVSVVSSHVPINSGVNYGPRGQLLRSCTTVKKNKVRIFAVNEQDGLNTENTGGTVDGSLQYCVT